MSNKIYLKFGSFENLPDNQNAKSDFIYENRNLMTFRIFNSVFSQTN